MAELRNIKWNKLVRDLLGQDCQPALLKSRSLQWALTIALRKQNMMVLDWNKDLIIEHNGCRFYTDLINYPRVFEAEYRYRLDAIKDRDEVLDIGANIGSYSIPCLTKGAIVSSVEPMFYRTLKRNLILNSLDAGIIINRAVEAAEVDCQEYKEVCESVSIEKILNSSEIEALDVVRLDCGGQEWNIHPSVFGTPRVLEIEFHFFKNNDWKRWQSSDWKKWLEVAGYGYKARWSKHRHWLYVSAGLDMPKREEVQLVDGSFIGRNLELWKCQ